MGPITTALFYLHGHRSRNSLSSFLRISFPSHVTSLLPLLPAERDATIIVTSSWIHNVHTSFWQITRPMDRFGLRRELCWWSREQLIRCDNGERVPCGIRLVRLERSFYKHIFWPFFFFLMHPQVWRYMFRPYNRTHAKGFFGIIRLTPSSWMRSIMDVWFSSLISVS